MSDRNPNSGDPAFEAEAFRWSLDAPVPVPTATPLGVSILREHFRRLRHEATALDMSATWLGTHGHITALLSEDLQTHAAKLNELLDELQCSRCESRVATELDGLNGRVCEDCLTLERA